MRLAIQYARPQRIQKTLYAALLLVGPIPPIAVVELIEDHTRVFECVSPLDSQLKNAREEVLKIRYIPPHEQCVSGVLPQVTYTFG